MFRWTARCLIWLGGTASTNALGTEVRPGAGMFVNVIPEGVQKNRRTAAHFNPTANPADVLLNNNFAAPELRHSIGRMPQNKPQMLRWSRRLRADVYDELLKLPLRYALHSFDRLHAHLNVHGSMTDGDDTSVASLPPGVYQHDTNASKSTEHTAAVAEANDASLYAVAGRSSSVGYAPPLGPADPLDTIGFFVHRSSNGHLPGKLYSMNTKILMPAFYMRIQNVDGDMFRFEEELLKIFPTQKIFGSARERLSKPKVSKRVGCLSTDPPHTSPLFTLTSSKCPECWENHPHHCMPLHAHPASYFSPRNIHHRQSVAYNLTA